jgi:polysaccharide biosynthesis transport protein
MSLYQLMLILRARAWVVLIAIALGVIAAVAVNLLMPQEYTGVATVVVDSRATDTVTGQALPPPLMATQMEIVKSHRVALEVVNATRLAESPVAREMFIRKTDGRGSIKDWWADRLLLSTEVQARRESNLVDIKFTAQDPRFAALATNAFARAYMDIALMINLEPARQTSSFFDDQLKNLRANLEKAQSRLSDYQQKYGIVVTDERMDVENARLEELYTEMARVQGDMRDSVTRERQAAEYARRGRSPEEIPEVLANPLIQSLKGELVRAEAKFKESSTTLGVNHPQIQRQKAEIDALRGKIDEEIRFAVGGMSTMSSIQTSREAQLRRAVAEQKDKMLQVKGQRDEVAVMRGEVESAQKAYDAALQRFTVTTLSSRSNQANVMLLNPAVEPTETSSPKVFRNLLVGLIAGLVLGLNLAFLLEVSDRRVRSGDDIGTELALPVLGVLERSWGDGSRTRRFLPGKRRPPRLLPGMRPSPT